MNYFIPKKKEYNKNKTRGEVILNNHNSWADETKNKQPKNGPKPYIVGQHNPTPSKPTQNPKLSPSISHTIHPQQSAASISLRYSFTLLPSQK